MNIAIGLMILLLSALLIGLYRRCAIYCGWIDRPNARSSHHIPTPRGAGMVLALVIAVCALHWLHDAALPLRGTLLAGLVIAVTGWIDDIRGLSARTRLLVYGLVCIGIVLQIAPLLPALGSYARMLTLLAIVLGLLWLINLYNFMDGINGIAGLEAVFVMVAGALLGRTSAFGAGSADFLLAATGAVCGFLFWNFPRGRIFLGDAGSAFLGFVLGATVLWSVLLDGPSLAVWLILLGVFVVDASYTLLARLCTGQPWHEGHRLHAYQLVARRWGSHSRVVSVIAAINVCWLLPWAWLAQRGDVGPVLATTLAYLPLIALCRWLKAGIPEAARV